MPISALPTPPSRSDAPQDFSDRADALLGALPGFVTEANALQSDVNAKEASASSYATIATDKAAEAQGHATTASTKASEAAASAVAAAAAASNAEIAFDSFDDKYLGSKASDPTTDNDGNALLVGALYWNTTVGAVRVWNGSSWLSMAADASIVDFQQAGTGAVVRTAQDKMREWVSVKDFGAVGDGVADDTVAIQSSINYAAATGRHVYAPAGRYKHSDTIQCARHVNIVGDGSCHDPQIAGFDGGTIFEYTGTADGWQMNSPINTSTPVHICISKMTFYAPNIVSGKAAFADTCGTQIYFDLCSFVFNAAGVGLIFDQTEVSGVTRSQFLAKGSGYGACIWLVNGSTRTPGADQYFTNMINVSECQINPANTGARGILDEGGITHNFVRNNFNGGSLQIEASAVNGLLVSGNEMEAASIAICRVYRGGSNEPSPQVTFENNTILVIPGAVGLDVAANTCDVITYTNNIYNAGAGIAVDSVLSQNSIVAYGNYNRGGGTQPLNNYSTPRAVATSQLTVVGETTAGNSTYTNRAVTYSRSGDIVTVSGAFAIATKDPSTAGWIRIEGLPLPAARLDFSGISVSVLGGYTLPAGYTHIVGLIPKDQTHILLYISGPGVNFSRLSASDISAGFEVFINGSYFAS